MKTLLGLNWGHRRALGPMQAAARLAHERLGVEVRWEVQNLAGFEHGLSAHVADRFDVVVFDHPFCGDVAANGWMLPLEDRFNDFSDTDFAGDSLASYRYAGHLWALPIDAATQCALYRPDLVPADALPGSWVEAMRLGQQLRSSGRSMAIAAASPHGVLALLALCANLGVPLAQHPRADPFDPGVFCQAAELLREALALSDNRCLQMNAIDLHEAMVHEDAIAYCPLAYVYTTYAEADQRRPLRFHGFPGPSGHDAGSVLGGTGIGITRHCAEPDAAFAFLGLLSDPGVQRSTFMRHHGQPARIEGWRGAPEDDAFAGSHTSLRPAMAGAWTRPRFPGYVRWQAEAGHDVERYLGGGYSASGLRTALDDAWRRHAPALSAVRT